MSLPRLDFKIVHVDQAGRDEDAHSREWSKKSKGARCDVGVTLIMIN